MLVYKENENLKNECRMLQDKVNILENEVGHMRSQDPRPLQDEVERLNRLLQERDAQANREMAE